VSFLIDIVTASTSSFQHSSFLWRSWWPTYPWKVLPIMCIILKKNLTQYLFST